MDAQAVALKKNLFSHVMKSAEVDAAFAQIQDSWDVFVKPNHGVTFRVSTKKLPWKVHTEADEFWFVRRGSAKVGLAPFSLQMGVTPPGDVHEVAAGDVVYVPRHLAYQIEPGAGRFEYVAVRIFVPRPPRTGGRGGSEAGGADTQAPGTYVAKKVQIDQSFATEPRSTRLRFPDGMGVAQIIYNGAIGPYESHETADQIYFVRHGTARAYFDGRLVDAKVTTPGQIRGTGVIDASEYTIGPGDIVWLPRNQVHFVDPGMGRIGYFLVGIPTFR
jgi:mannose-6-phosphate isomerase-like protein (cupin superfamily)